MKKKLTNDGLVVVFNNESDADFAISELCFRDYGFHILNIEGEQYVNLKELLQYTNFRTIKEFTKDIECKRREIRFPFFINKPHDNNNYYTIQRDSNLILLDDAMSYIITYGNGDGESKMRYYYNDYHGLFIEAIRFEDYKIVPNDPTWDVMIMQ